MSGRRPLAVRAATSYTASRHGAGEAAAREAKDVPERFVTVGHCAGWRWAFVKASRRETTQAEAGTFTWVPSSVNVRRFGYRQVILLRLFLWIVAAGAIAFVIPAPVRAAASDIAIAAIATGRLYVIGRTEQPHTLVVLDGQFQTESDDTGKFQYELVYHPARCVVSARIEGKVYEAVVSNCGEQCQLAVADRAGPASATRTPPVEPAPVIGSRSDGPVALDSAANATPSSRMMAPLAPRSRASPGQAPGAALPLSRSVGVAVEGQSSASAIIDPPLPPTRPVRLARQSPRAEASVRPAKTVRATQRPRPALRQKQDNSQVSPVD